MLAHWSYVVLALTHWYFQFILAFIQSTADALFYLVCIQSMKQLYFTLLLALKTEIFWNDKVNTKAVDALAPCIARSSATIESTVQDKNVLVFHKKGYQLTTWDLWVVRNNRECKYIFKFPKKLIKHVTSVKNTSQDMSVWGLAAQPYNSKMKLKKIISYILQEFSVNMMEGFLWPVEPAATEVHLSRLGLPNLLNTHNVGVEILVTAGTEGRSHGIALKEPESECCIVLKSMVISNRCHCGLVKPYSNIDLGQHRLR